MRARTFAVSSALLLAVAGCGAQTSGDPPPESPPSTSYVPVSVHQTGGIAGIDERVTVDPHGAWTKTTRGATTSGRLSGEQRARLQVLATDPRLAAEALRTGTANLCADAFTYTVTVAAVTVKYGDCGADPEQPQAAMAIVAFLDQVIPD